MGYVGLKLRKENSAINIYWVASVYMTERHRSGKIRENRLHSMRNENLGWKPENHHCFFMMVEEEHPTQKKKEMEEEEELNMK